MDCESAARAVLSFAASRAAALAGTYGAVNPAADVWPGDVLAITSGGQTMSVVVRRVTVADGMASPEMLTYRIEFANDWAEGLGLKLSEAIAGDAIVSETGIESLWNAEYERVRADLADKERSNLAFDAGEVPGDGPVAPLMNWRTPLPLFASAVVPLAVIVPSKSVR